MPSLRLNSYNVNVALQSGSENLNLRRPAESGHADLVIPPLTGTDFVSESMARRRQVRTDMSRIYQADLMSRRLVEADLIFQRSFRNRTAAQEHLPPGLLTERKSADSTPVEGGKSQFPAFVNRTETNLVLTAADRRYYRIAAFIFR